MSDAWQFILPVLFVIGFVAVVGAVVYLILRWRSGEPVLVSLPFLLRIYLYVASLASLLVLVNGLASLANWGFGQGFGKEFSYTPEFLSRPGPVHPREGQSKEELVAEEEKRQAEEEKKQEQEGLARAALRGLVDGITLTIVGGLIFAMHWAGRRVLEAPEERRRGFLDRAYVFLLLVIFGVGAIVSLPQALVQSVFFSIEGAGGVDYRGPPGRNLATALVFVPFWLYYLLALLRQVRRGEQ